MLIFTLSELKFGKTGDAKFCASTNHLSHYCGS